MNYFFRSVIDWVVIMALAIIGAAISLALDWVSIL